MLEGRNSSSFQALTLPSILAFKLQSILASKLTSLLTFQPEGNLTPQIQLNLIDNINNFTYKIDYAGVVKLVDALDSKSSGPCVRASSILASGTIKNKGFARLAGPFSSGSDLPFFIPGLQSIP